MTAPSDSNAIPPHPARGGVFITKGARVRIPAGGLRIAFTDGKVEASATLHVGLILCPLVQHAVSAGARAALGAGRSALMRLRKQPYSFGGPREWTDGREATRKEHPPVRA